MIKMEEENKNGSMQNDARDDLLPNGKDVSIVYTDYDDEYRTVWEKSNNERNKGVVARKGKAIDKEQLEVIKSSLLYPTEVTFSNHISHNELKIPNSETDSIASSTNSNYKSKIPDGGYGWMVVFSSVIISLIADGVSFSFGLIYTELLKYFQESKSKTAWIGSLFLAVPLLSGPIMSNLVDRYGCRKMTIIGGVFAGLGFALGSFNDSVEGLYLTFGVISGIGLGIGYVTAVVSVAFWFDKKRTLAIGIGASGTGMGTFVYAPFTQWLIDTYGWRGTSLMIAGTLFNICVCGCLMRDPDWLIEENRLESRSQSVATFSNSSVCLDEIKKLLETGAPKEDVLDTLVTNFNTEANQQISIPEKIVAEKKYKSELLLPTFSGSQSLDFLHDTNRSNSRRSLRKRDEVQLNPHEFIAPEKKCTIIAPKKIHLASQETLNESEKASHQFETCSLDEASLNSEHNGEITQPRSRKSWLDENMISSRYSLDESLMLRANSDEYIHDDLEHYRKSIRGNSLDVIYENDLFKNDDLHKSDQHINGGKVFDQNLPLISTKKILAHRSNTMPKRRPVMRNANYLKNIRFHRNSITYRSAILNTHRYRMKASSCPNIYRNSMTTLAREEEDKWYTDFVDLVRAIFDFSLFLNAKFALINVSFLLLFISFIVPYFYITEYVKTLGMDEDDGAMLIAVIGVFNTLGMIVLGWLGDLSFVNVTKTYALCMVICGFSIGFIPIAGPNMYLQIFLAIVFGVTFASSYSYTPNILVRIVDLDDFTNAYGLVLMMQGFGNLIGPPLAGIIFESTLRWDEAFYVAGVFTIISGLLAYFTALLEDRDEAKLNNKDPEGTISSAESK